MENQEIQTENILDNKERAYATGKEKILLLESG